MADAFVSLMETLRKQRERQQKKKTNVGAMLPQLGGVRLRHHGKGCPWSSVLCRTSKQNFNKSSNYI